MSKFSLFAIKKLDVKLIFNSVSGNYDPLFSPEVLTIHILEGFCSGVEAGGFLCTRFCVWGVMS